MKEIIGIYKTNRVTVENYLVSMLHNTRENLDEKALMAYFPTTPALEAVYVVDKTYTQVTPHFHRTKVDTTSRGINRDFMFNRIQFQKDGTYMSQAYMSSQSGRPSITTVKKIGDDYLVFDFNLMKLLEQLRLIENNLMFNRISKWMYSAIGFGLVLFSLFLIGYALSTFAASFIDVKVLSLQTTFNSIIAMTLGLAIFDLSRTILEQEVFFKSYSVEPAEENRLLMRFLTSIIIALSIESLMVVFKIALENYKDMGYAIYLIAGVSSMIISLGVFSYLTRERRAK